jgi:hypothetical protein
VGDEGISDATWHSPKGPFLEASEWNDEGCTVTLTGCGKAQFLLRAHCDLAKRDVARTACRMLKMAVQRGRSE